MSVRALVRPHSDTSFLERLGVVLQRGDMTEAPALQEALDGAEVVIHCAAKVGDWGPVEDYRAVNVEGLITYRQNGYSVPWRYIGDVLPVRVTENEVIIYSPQVQEITRHPLLVLATK